MKRLVKLIRIACLVLSTFLIVLPVMAYDIKIEIDVKPLSCPQSINPNSKGNTPIAILTTNSFDAATVDPVTVVFAGASPLFWAMEDYDSDGDVDMVLHFKTQECVDLQGLSRGFHYVELTAENYGGAELWDQDRVKIVQAWKGP